MGRAQMSEWRRHAAFMEKIERKYRRAYAAEIRRAAEVAVDEWLRTGAVPQMPEHEQAIRDIVRHQVSTAIAVAGGRLARQFGKKHIERKDFAATVAKWASRYITLEAIRRRITAIAETTRAQIVGAVERGFAAGMAQNAVAAAIRAAVPQIAVARSKVIARTETHGAAGYGAQAAAHETGLDLVKVWIAAEDERTRQSHADADGQRVRMDEAFSIGGEALMFPGDPNASPENVINCRCAVGYEPA
jgi:uncharacterized protein with gpF-like domain